MYDIDKTFHKMFEALDIVVGKWGGGEGDDNSCINMYTSIFILFSGLIKFW